MVHAERLLALSPYMTTSYFRIDIVTNGPGGQTFELKRERSTTLIRSRRIIDAVHYHQLRRLTNRNLFVWLQEGFDVRLRAATLLAALSDDLCSDAAGYR
jgi:hypothetical protein